MAINACFFDLVHAVLDLAVDHGVVWACEGVGQVLFLESDSEGLNIRTWLLNFRCCSRLMALTIDEDTIMNYRHDIPYTQYNPY